MHVLGFQPLDQRGVHDADSLAVSAGKVDVNGASALREQDEIRVIHRVGLAADGVDGEWLKRLCVQNLSQGFGVHERRVGALFHLASMHEGRGDWPP